MQLTSNRLEVAHQWVNVYIKARLISKVKNKHAN